MALQKVTELTEPPVVGNFYLVPCVQITSALTAHRQNSFVPVRGKLHTDKEISFPYKHFHYDWRFVPQRDFTRISLAAVLNTNGPYFSPGGICNEEVVWRKKKCVREEVIAFGLANLGNKLANIYRGQKLDEAMTCPHREVSLKSCPAKNGVITCPLHGMRFDAATGEIISDPKPTDLM